MLLPLLLIPVAIVGAVVLVRSLQASDSTGAQAPLPAPPEPLPLPPAPDAQDAPDRPGPMPQARPGVGTVGGAVPVGQPLPAATVSFMQWEVDKIKDSRPTARPVVEGFDDVVLPQFFPGFDAASHSVVRVVKNGPANPHDIDATIYMRAWSGGTGFQDATIKLRFKGELGGADVLTIHPTVNVIGITPESNFSLPREHLPRLVVSKDTDHTEVFITLAPGHGGMYMVTGPLRLNYHNYR